MYNLFISGKKDSFGGEPWIIELSRCVREYTLPSITEKYGTLDMASILELKKMPCIFGYEAVCEKAPKFGIITEITRRQEQVRVEYQIQNVDPFLTAKSLEDMAFELNIVEWELNRTHWAVKDVNLPKELKRQGVIIPDWSEGTSPTVDVSTHSFAVGLSFPGEVRDLVKSVAVELEGRLGSNSCFYDGNYVAQLARPSLDTLLQDIYRNRSELIVVFIGGDYQRSDWCGIEWRAIREIIQRREDERIMFVKIDDGDVDGVFNADGYIDATKLTPAEIAGYIEERVNSFKLLK